ncbi:RnfABCDGE type electron transport complex subunit G [candidate division KSB1 bacterium]|nr:RnfABCDGE type electron transport complex subunit G [candidate division KSB1 bacterium]
MKEIIKLGVILALITAIAAAGLAAVYSVTKPRIEEQKQKALQAALTQALPQSPAEAIEPVETEGTVSYYIGYESPAKENISGYAFLARGPGYSSVIETMVGVDTAGEIIGMKVLDQKETPGLGTKVEEIRYGENDPWFLRQFMEKKAGQLAVDKDGGEITSITGATISARALTNSVVKGYQELRTRVEKLP